MGSMTTFQPNWTIPPGATVLDLLRERGKRVEELAQATHKDITSVSRLLFGVEPLTADWAESLAQVLGASPAFWLRREERYRADLQRLCDLPAEESTATWLDDLPLRDMIRYGWVQQGQSTRETALNVCAFFGVTNGESYKKKYQSLLSSAAYRSSATYAPRPSAVAAWLRQGEIVASAIDCMPWSDVALRDSLDEIRALTREPDPARFIPELQRIFARCGVAMVVARAPEGCRASGATRFLDNNKAVVQLSFRYLSDDQFWFTVFHEVGHILLHAHEDLYLEGLEDRNSQAEIEADDFALKTLFAKVGVDALDQGIQSKFEIARLARKAGVSPGVVVGRLQDKGLIPYKHFNYMKARYAWSEGLH